MDHRPTLRTLATVVQHDGGFAVVVAWPYRLARETLTFPLVAFGPAGHCRRGNTDEPPHLAGPRPRRDHGGGAAGTQNAGDAGATRRLCDLLPVFLHPVVELLLLAKSAHRCSHAVVPSGFAHGAGQQPPSCRPPAAVAVSQNRTLDGAFGRPHHGFFVHVFPAHRPAVGHAW